MPHVSTVPAAPCAGTDGWAILAEPPGVRDLEDARYWQASRERSQSRRGTRPVSGFGGGRELRVAAALAMTSLAVPAVAGASTVDLKLGSSGDSVRALQQQLGITADGAFGPATLHAVRSYQRAHGLPVTGLVGPLTRAALGEGGSTTSPGGSATSPSTSVRASSSQVKEIQRSLGVTIDGVVGPETRAAIKSYESAHGLPTSGEPDPQLMKALGVGSGVTPTTTTTTTDPAATTTPAPAASSKGAAAVQAAMTKIGASYSYGAVGPSSFDCSGLVMWAFRQAGVTLPHSSFAQASMGTHVDSRQIQPGDLVFFNTAGAGASDVGIATSASTAVSATSHGVMTHSIHSGYWGSHYVGARRIA